MFYFIHLSSSTLNDTFFQYVMQVQHPLIATIVVHNDELGDGVGTHQMQCVDSVLRSGDMLGVVGHDVASGECVDVVARFHLAAQLAVGDNS